MKAVRSFKTSNKAPSLHFFAVFQLSCYILFPEKSFSVDFATIYVLFTTFHFPLYHILNLLLTVLACNMTRVIRTPPIQSYTADYVIIWQKSNDSSGNVEKSL